MEFPGIARQRANGLKRACHSVRSPFYGFLLVGYAVAGWCLCAYAVPYSVWLGTLLVTLHLVWVGTDAVLPGFIWVNGVLSIAAIDRAWMWRMPIVADQLIPFILLLIWFFALGLLRLVAIAHHHLQQQRIPASQRFYWLIVPIAQGVVFGVCAYQLFTLPRIQ